MRIGERFFGDFKNYFIRWSFVRVVEIEVSVIWVIMIDVILFVLIGRYFVLYVRC